MTNDQIKYSIETGELKLGNWHKFTHYGIVGFFLIFPAMFVFFRLKEYLEGTSKPFMEFEFWFSVIPAILGLMFYRLQRNRLKFKIIHTNLTREEIDPIIEKVANELQWIIVIDNKKAIIAKTQPSFFSGSWGEQITILFDGKKTLVNSICDPDKKSSVVSMGRNKQNMNKLVEEIERASL